MSRRARAAVTVLAVPVVLLAVWGWRSSFSRQESGWAEVKAEPFVRIIEAGGELRSTDTVSVGPPRIERMWQFTVTTMAPEGKPIEEGQPLVSFDAQEPMERLEVKRSNLETARKEYEKTELETTEHLEALSLELVELQAKLARLVRKLDVPAEQRSRIELQKLRLESTLAGEEIELTERRIRVQRRNRAARVEAARQRVDTLESEIGRIEDEIARMQVAAPRSGFVVHTANWRGEKVQVGESIYYGQQLVEIADLDRMELAAEVAEPDAGSVAVGNKAEIRIDAAPDRTFTGSVVKLGRLFRTRSWDSPSRVFDATVSIDDPDPDLMRPGMAASVEIVSRSEGDRFQVPESAVIHTEDGSFMEIQRGSDAGSRVPVVLGDRYDGKIVIREGLLPGDRYRVEAGAGTP